MSPHPWVVRIMGMDRTLRRARTALDAHDWALAASWFRAAAAVFPTRVPPAVFAGLAHAEWGRGLADLAEAAMREGLAAHPDDVGLLIGHAELASRRGAPDEAACRWEHAAAVSGAAFPQSAMLRFAEALEGLGRQEEQRAWLDKAAELGPRDVELLLRVAELYHAARDWPNAARAYVRLIRARGDAAGLSAFFKLRGSLQHAGRMNDADVWLSLAGDAGRRAAASYHALLTLGDREQATALFAGAISGWLDDEDVAGRWRDAFACLADILLPDAGGAPSTQRQETRVPLRKLIVSGMGWSGSGAIYDFLREFPEIHPIKGEFKYIEGNPGLASLWSRAGDRERFDQELVAFFGHALLGLDEPASQSAYMTAYQARLMARGGGKLRYAQAVLGFMQQARQRLAGCPGAVPLETFRALATELIDGVPIGGQVPEGGIALLDNVVHIGQASCIEFLEQTRIFCTFRDPRSNYAALVRESTGYSESPVAFARRYRQQRQRYAQVFDGPLRGHPAVELVQFERFVLDEDFRRELAVRAGLQLEHWRRHEHFQPWVSEANVFLHEDFEDQDAIAAIEKALPEYCIDAHTLNREAR